MDDDDVPTDDERQSRHRYDGPYVKSVSSLSNFARSNNHDKQEVINQVKKTNKAPYFGYLADKQVRFDIRHSPDAREYMNQLSDSDAPSRLKRFDAMLTSAEPLHIQFTKKLDHVTRNLPLGESFGYNIDENGAKIRGKIHRTATGVVQEIDAVRLPYELRGDGTIGKIIDHFINRGYKIKVNDVIGPAMAGAIFNRGFHTHNNNMPAAFDQTTDYLFHNQSDKTWTYDQAPYNKMLAANRNHVKILPLNTMDPYGLINSSSASAERKELNDFFNQKINLLRHHYGNDPELEKTMVNNQFVGAEHLNNQINNNTSTRDERLNKVLDEFDDIEMKLEEEKKNYF